MAGNARPTLLPSRAWERGLRMSIIKQKQAEKGSQKWLQCLINNSNSIEIINKEIYSQLNLSKGIEISWLSPLQGNDFSEYSDNDFIERLGIKLQKPLSDFWPHRGPVWDGLAKTNDLLFLIEAKAHLRELISTKTGAKEPSLDKIRNALKKTQSFLKAGPCLDWAEFFYQYTNRIAHLYFLREINKIPAYMIFLYFINDTEMNGPTTKEEWEGALKIINMLLGINNHKLKPYLMDIFISTNEITQLV